MKTVTSIKGFALIFLLYLLFFLPEVLLADNKVDLVLYAGQAIHDDFKDIFLHQPNTYVPSYIYVAALNYTLDAKIRDLRFEAEAQAAKHEGIQNHWETNVLLIARLTFFQNHFPCSIAFGDGISYAWKTPTLPEEHPPTKLLNYMMVEVDAGPAGIDWQPRFLIRIHHRSGIFGTYCDDTCGSNFIVFGIKTAF